MMTLYERALYVVAIALLLVGFVALHSHNETLKAEVADHEATTQAAK